MTIFILLSAVAQKQPAGGIVTVGVVLLPQPPQLHKIIEKKDDKISVTGKGNLLVKADGIYIIHGNEKQAPVKYTVENNQLVFEDAAQYTKPAIAYANK